MKRRKRNIKEPIAKIWQEEPDHISRLIWHEIHALAIDHGYYLIQNKYFHLMADPQWNDKTRKMDPARYPDLGQWTFDYWFDRLVEDGYLEVDQNTRSIKAVHLMIVERENSVNPDA